MLLVYVGGGGGGKNCLRVRARDESKNCLRGRIKSVLSLIITDLCLLLIVVELCLLLIVTELCLSLITAYLCWALLYYVIVAGAHAVGVVCHSPLTPLSVMVSGIN